MANESKRISVSELDFDQIKSNLKSFLQAQDQFSDYDFDGSGLSILLDVLAYNTHYNALYTNLAVNEMFLDSASKRSSVVSLAKALGYTPQSARSATAKIRLTVNPTNTFPTTLTLPKNSSFTSTINETEYTFYTTEDITIVSAESTATYGLPYVFNNVEITQGTPLTFAYTVATGQKYIIPNSNADMSTLKVQVQDSPSSDIFTTYIPAASLVDLAYDSRVYYSKEIDGGLFEIVFGDDIVSAALTNGNVVHLDYFVSNTSNANGARSFSYTGSTLISGSTVSIAIIEPASGGVDSEAIDSIKYNAPRLYTAQNRAVTTDDYAALIQSNFPQISSVSVWGGEDNDPPVYGKTFICPKPINAIRLSQQEKSDIITTLLDKRNVVSITPVIVDPEYINIALTCNVYFNDRLTNKSASEIASMVTATILNYNNNDLQRFDSVFRFSKLSRLIDITERSIISNITTVVIRRKVSPRYNVSAQYIINLINPIYTKGVPEESVSSTGFYIKGSNNIHYLQDDGIGNIQLYYNSAVTTSTGGATTISASKVVTNTKLGTVDYANGIIDIKNLHITSLADVDFELTIKPQSNDIVSAFTQIAEIAPEHLTVTALADKTINGDLRGGKNYVFTSSRS